MFSVCVVFSQTNNNEMKLLLNDSLKFSIKNSSNEKITLLIDDKKIVDIITWPNQNIRNILVEQNDSTFLRLGFNYVSKLISKGEYKYKDDNLIANGCHYHFTDEGILSHVYTYLDGQLNGAYKSYHSNGMLELSGNYYLGNKTGIWLHYSKKGTLLKKESF